MPVLGVGGSILECEVDDRRVRRGPLEPALGELALELVGFRHRLGEVGIDRIELLDGREMRRLVLPDEGAFGHQRAPDPSGNRSADGRIVEVELRARHRGLLRRDLGIGLAPRRDGDVVLRFRGRLPGQQRFLPLLLARREELRRLRLRQRGLGAFEVDLERLGIDAIEDAALLHQAALLEATLDDDPRDARTNLGDADRRDAARQLFGQRDLPRLDRHHADVGRRGRFRGGRMLLAASGEADQGHQREQHAGERRRRRFEKSGIHGHLFEASRSRSTIKERPHVVPCGESAVERLVAATGQILFT